MKRFWVFVIICVVALGIGFTTFRFMTREEILYVNQTVFEVNSGENIILDIVQENLKSGTEIYVTSSNEDIVYRTDNPSKYEFKASKGGSTTIVVTSNLKGFNPVSIQVTVGDGNYATPFLIKSKDDLAKIGTSTLDEDGIAREFPLSCSYKLVSNISLDGTTWTPIGKDSDNGFTGTFNFNGNAISNMTIESGNGNIGLFAKIGEGGSVYGANLTDVNISANGANIGTVAGVNAGTIDKAVVDRVTIKNSSENTITGALVGTNNGTISKSKVYNATIEATGANTVVGGLVGRSELMSVRSSASIFRSGVEFSSLKAKKSVGGLVGENCGAIIENCYAGTLESKILDNPENVGGIVGVLEVKTFSTDSKVISYLADTYNLVDLNTVSSNKGGIVGSNKNLSDTYNVLYGNYYSKDINSGIEAIATQTYKPASEQGEEGVYAKTTEELKQQAIYKSYIDEKTKLWTNWEFDEGVWTISEGAGFPQLSFVEDFIPTRVYNFASPYEVNESNFVNKLKDADSQTVYRLASNVTLSSKNGYKPFEFNGQLTCPLDESGKPKYTIYLTIDSNDGVVDGVAALFTKLGESAKISNIKVVMEIHDTVTNANHIATLAGYNNGIVDNCYAENANGYSLTTGCATGEVYIGGVIAENFGKISNCLSTANISYTKTPAKLYIGGISASSTNTIQRSKNGGKIVMDSASESYVAGIVGYTNANVLYCANGADIEGKVDNDNAYFAGVVSYLAQSSDAKIKYSSNSGAIRGSKIGGIVGISMGTIEYCYSSGNYTGKIVGGLAYNIKQGVAGNPSFIKNCMTAGNMLNGLGDSSIICGAVYQIDVTPDHLAFGENIFTSTYFISNGAKYYETTSNIRGEEHEWQLWGVKGYIDKDAFNNCVHVERDGDIERQRKVKAEITASYRPGKDDIQITEDQAKGSDGYVAFSSNGFDRKYWDYPEGTGSYIMVKDVALYEAR